MLGKNNKDDGKKKKESQLDKVVFGAIIGTAIGSAIGASIAPQKGKETREQIVEKGSEAAKLTKETARGIFKLAKRLLFGKKKTQKEEVDSMREAVSEQSKRFVPFDDMRAIPHEGEVFEDTPE